MTSAGVGRAQLCRRQRGDKAAPLETASREDDVQAGLMSGVASGWRFSARCCVPCSMAPRAA